MVRLGKSGPNSLWAVRGRNTVWSVHESLNQGLNANILSDHMSRVNLERDQVKALYKKGMKEKS